MTACSNAYCKAEGLTYLVEHRKRIVGAVCERCKDAVEAGKSLTLQAKEPGHLIGYAAGELALYSASPDESQPVELTEQPSLFAS